jgi:hypothetical protein
MDHAEKKPKPDDGPFGIDNRKPISTPTSFRLFLALRREGMLTWQPQHPCWGDPSRGHALNRRVSILMLSKSQPLSGTGRV